MPKTNNKRDIPQQVTYSLWGASAGVCEFRGCPEVLYLHHITMEEGNFSQRAHIKAVSEKGPRYRELMPNEELNSFENLMLTCHKCHKLIDDNPEIYTVDVLKEMKREHEKIIYDLLRVGRNQQTSMYKYFVNISNVQPVYDDSLFCRAVVLNGKIPKEKYAAALAETRLPFDDGEENFYSIHTKALEKARAVLEASANRNENISIFALAPIPLLIKLGTIISDITNVTVYQCHREGEKWAWKKDCNDIITYEKSIYEGSIIDDCVALNLSLSADISHERIIKSTGNIRIYKITINEPSLGFAKTESIVDDFIKKFRETMEKIKRENPTIKGIKVYSAIPNSVAVRLGMNYMPKTDPKLILYDNINNDKGFIETISIGG